MPQNPQFNFMNQEVINFGSNLNEPNEFFEESQPRIAPFGLYGDYENEEERHVVLHQIMLRKKNTMTKMTISVLLANIIAMI